MKILKLILVVFLLLGGGVLYAQVRVVNGHVLDENNEALPGVTVAEAGNVKNAVSTDEKGNFRLTLKDKNSALRFTAIGYLPKTADAKDGVLLTVTMEPDVKGLEDVVIVGYSRQKKITNTGSVSSIKAEEIKSVPTSSLQNALVGRLPGFFSQQRSGQPGSDAAAFYIRGVNSLNGDSQPLIVVDDIEYTYEQVAQMNVNEIETITILKDAATTAIYGLKGANGVLVITTKRGKIGKPRINLATETGLNKVIRLPSYMDAYTTAMLQNEAYVNDSYGLSTPLALPWSASDLQKFKDGSDPYGHPNVNWNELILNKSSMQSRTNLDISGGNGIVKYFTSLGYFTQDGILKDFEPANPSDNVVANYFYNRINFRSNIDITPIKSLNIHFNGNGRFETINNPGGVLDGDGLFQELQTFRGLSPFAMPAINPNGTYGYANQAWGNGNPNPITRLANGGYRRNFNNNFNIDLGADQKLDFITTGLAARVTVSYAANTNENRAITRLAGELPVYYYNAAANTYTIRNSAQYRFPIFNSNISNGAFNNRTILQGSLSYDRAFGVHHIYSLALVNQNSYVNGGNVPQNYRGLTGKLGYDFKRKYLLEFNIIRNGNDLFRKEQRYGVFPVVSAGWNLSEEGFFKKTLPVFDLFKIKGSYGLVGSDKSYPGTILNAIQYNVSGGSTYFGNGVSEGALVNPAITWEKERKTNIALETVLFNGKLTFNADYFYAYRYDQLIAQGDVPTLIGQALPQKNIGITDNRGFELETSFKHKIGKVSYSVGGNVSYAKNKIVYFSEAPDYPYLARTGTQIGLTQGYRSIGFYQLSDFEANGAVKAGIPKPLWSTIQPGDLKYADLNGDGVITTADQTLLSKPNLPTTNFGTNLSLSYKGITLNTLVQGAFGYAVQINAQGSDAFNSNIRPWHLERWTPETAATATYPRLGFNATTNINNLSDKTTSDFWFVNASYVRLKSVELGYQVPGKWLSKVGFINSCRVYTAGYDLLTIRNVGKFDVDPEIASGRANAYPLTANFTLGLNVGF
ncbi:SusC/RagA family TonB-linked outer membrane protein [Hufsiella ginkgonis]|uniref:SusC/RagA family TonB-linked outer membrane protein n=1 Tax=Hufsiella ginkgonis TaxID=2695274 RepID=A0A7K1XZF0_9SPHI|nr:TonB-dependent receptor [Hufsiella ginkgonis]MXV16394.1 SusC/RagA family TonB-linked outer membrane protein [Hufsiella ginkgonis]